MAAQELKSRTPLYRMTRIHKQLVEGRYPNCSSLAKAIEVSTKTIQRGNCLDPNLEAYSGRLF